MDGRITRSALPGLTVALLVGSAPALAADPLGTDATVLRLGTFEAEPDASGVGYGPATFVERIAELSGGDLEVELVTEIGEGAPDGESQVVEAIASGEIDGGWPSVRAFADAGIDGLTAIEAPMTLTNYDALRELVSGPVAGKAIDLIDGSGIVGLGLAVGPLRRPFVAQEPLLDPADWAGVSMRSYNSPVQTATYEALGASAVPVSFGWIDMVRDGTLRGTEFDTFQALRNGLTDEAPYVTSNVVLWPKVFVLAMNEATLAGLTEEQRGWVLQAAADAVRASVEGSFDESPIATKLCDAGVRFFAADEAQLEALREAVQPVIDGLAAGDKSGALLADIQAIAAGHPGVDQPLVPAECQVAPPPDVLEAITDTVSDIPDGTYRQEVRLEDVEAAGLGNDAGWTGTWTLLVSDGTYRVTCRFVADPGRDCGNSRAEDLVLEAGYLRGEGDRVTFVADAEALRGFTECPPEDCFVPEPYHATWSFEDGQLTFSEIDDWAAGFSVVPWSRID